MKQNSIWTNCLIIGLLFIAMILSGCEGCAKIDPIDPPIKYNLINNTDQTIFFSGWKKCNSTETIPAGDTAVFYSIEPFSGKRNPPKNMKIWSFLMKDTITVHVGDKCIEYSVYIDTPDNILLRRNFVGMRNEEGEYMSVFTFPPEMEAKAKSCK